MSKKQPMSKAKKELIAGIIWLVAGLIFIVAGIISLTIEKNRTLNLILGIVFICCGSAMVGISIYSLIKSKKLMGQQPHQ